ncbi:hypothetical protein BSKO_01236 [Bryopsis sp. KO-2023]|nr:hypothetical protein BSKO_01236 [Bryopsis sp. KO-2023]
MSCPTDALNGRSATASVLRSLRGPGRIHRPRVGSDARAEQRAHGPTRLAPRNAVSTGDAGHRAVPSVKDTSENEKVTVYQGLRGDDFRHPLDQQNTALLRAIPGLQSLAKSLIGPVAEEVLLLENISTSVKVGPDQLPTISNLLVDACAMLEMEPPELYVRQSPVPNAYTLAIAGRQPFVVVHTSLLELLSPPELQAVLAHELGHLKCDHGVWLTVANVLALGTVSVLPVISNAVEEGVMRWLRAAELTCDRAALLVAQDREIVISALMKLAGGTPSFANELNIDAFLQQARSYDEATSSPLGWYLRNAQTRALSHPLPVMRAREIDRWSQSAQFKALLARNKGKKILPPKQTRQKR